MKPTSAFQAVLFDLDGTLLDTANDLGAALNHVLAQHHLPEVSATDFRPVASDGAKGLLELGFGERLSHLDFEVLRKEFLDFYHNNIALHTCLYPQIADLIQHLDSNNIAWGIVTNKPEGLSQILLPHFPDLVSSEILVGGDTLSKRKPDPEPLIYAASKINVAPENCLYVGDALRDIQAGNAANMTTVVANWGYIKQSDDVTQMASRLHFESATRNPIDYLTHKLIIKKAIEITHCFY